ncbi:MAG: VOC family protein [Solirubrobacteraceae bacterium]|nr:VOC family protein [Solirubrobacteraceae bacterium]
MSATEMAALEVSRVGVILAVADVERSKAFYTGRLGFAVEAEFEGPAYAILTRGGVRLSLAEQGHEAGDLPGVVPTAPTGHGSPQALLVLEVPSVGDAYETLKAQGVAFASEPFSPPWGGGRCFALDPDGFLIELEELA